MVNLVKLSFGGSQLRRRAVSFFFFSSTFFIRRKKRNNNQKDKGRNRSVALQVFIYLFVYWNGNWTFFWRFFFNRCNLETEDFKRGGPVSPNHCQLARGQRNVCWVYFEKQWMQYICINEHAYSQHCWTGLVFVLGVAIADRCIHLLKVHAEPGA